jgi:hypothetical protein
MKNPVRGKIANHGFEGRNFHEGFLEQERER